MEKREKIYIFISHSHQDIDKIRVIRNYLESLGGEPILFFLLSKTDKDEVEALIKDEIAARIWFIYAESDNAKLSTWVRTERDFAAKYPKTNILTLNLSECFVGDTPELTAEAKSTIWEAYKKMVLLNEIYFSYSASNRLLIEEIKNTFRKYGIHLVEDWREISNVFYTEQIYRDIEQKRFFVQFVSAYKYSGFLENELWVAMNKASVVFLVLLDFDPAATGDLLDRFHDFLSTNEISRVKVFSFDSSNIEASCDKLLHFMYERI